MSTVIVTGTDTEIGKTVTTAAMAAVALAQGRTVAVLKPAQTGVQKDEPGDIAEVQRLAGEVTGSELARFPDPLAPATAARRAGRAPVRPREVERAARTLAGNHDLVLVEGAGGLLVRFDEAGSSLADVAQLLNAPVLVVARAGLGTLNAAALTTEALQTRGVTCLGVVFGSFPAAPDLATRCNLSDMPDASGVPLLGAIPAGAGARSPADFRMAAAGWLAPALGGTWDAATFAASLHDA
ncbi:dethiobiotin synthase [Streptomyces zagrosensis]|uniref:ATP-dependent dethiobiotin synthetase BioD n=1 Tax=Streptomyces zagrosensis TaxID=1042984 RepID=A0A7W9QBG8_9ACTN|nr:dethiobiotin synthase [Streptomyces zagrosensis]MBB5937115.1 dethiobiotin synthetase [Streptomyces zagrosensis]